MKLQQTFALLLPFQLNAVSEACSSVEYLSTVVQPVLESESRLTGDAAESETSGLLPGATIATENGPGDFGAVLEALARRDFDDLGSHRPDLLVSLLDPRVLTRPADLSYAAESAALIGGDRSHVVASLLPLLAHSRPTVREGVMYGLEPDLDNPKVRAAIAEVAKNDSSAAVRAIAHDLLA